MTLAVLDPFDDVETPETMATIGEEVAGLAVHVVELGRRMEHVDESVSAVHKRIDARPSWPIATILGAQSTAIGILVTYILTHAPK